MTEAPKAARQQALFIPMEGPGGGQRFGLYHAPALRPGLRPGAVAGAVVYVHPFAEEMNKSRRMAALQSRALARAGYAVLQLDLLGCGDSSGDFADATWAAWLADVAAAARWLRAQHGAPLWLWGLRAGCLLAAEAAPLLGEPCHFLFWQPPAAGKTLLQQFLRLKMAAQMLDGKALGATDALRTRLTTGQAVEIAGYTLSPALAQGLEQAQLRPPVKATQSIWLEVSTRAEATLLPGTQNAVAAWRKAGHDTSASAVTGPSFWQTQEIEDAPALIAATLQALEQTRVVA